MCLCATLVTLGVFAIVLSSGWSTGFPPSRVETTYAELSSSRGFPKPVVRYTAFPVSSSATGKTIVITGGAGFIGSQLGYHLHRMGHRVVLIDNMRFGYLDNLEVNGEQFGQFVEADVLDPRIDMFFDSADVVFHFAALSALPVCQSHPRDAMNVNVGGVANVLEICRKRGVRRFIFASTSAVYENTKHKDGSPADEKLILSEDLDVNPHLLYSLSKYQAELLVKSYSATYQLDSVILRFFNVYGPHQDFRRQSPPFTSYIIRELVNHARPVLHSDGTQRRDYVHVDDLMRLAVLVMNHPNASNEVFNVASGTHYSVNEMFEIVKKALKSDITPIFNPAERFWDKYPQLFDGKKPIKKEILIHEVNKRTVGSYAKAQRLLGWTPQVSMERGLASMVEFVQRDQKRNQAVLSKKATTSGWSAVANGTV